MMPLVPPSFTRNWLEKREESKSRPIHDSYGSEQFVATETAVKSFTRVATQNLSHSSYSLHATNSQLDVYASLADGWDGEESLAPSANAVLLAKQILDMIPAGISVPHPMISKEGVIGFYWSDENAFADIEIDGDNTFSIYAKRRKGAPFERYVEAISVDENARHALAECLVPLGRI